MKIKNKNSPLKNGIPRRSVFLRCTCIIVTGICLWFTSWPYLKLNSVHGLVPGYVVFNAFSEDAVIVEITSPLRVRVPIRSLYFGRDNMFVFILDKEQRIIWDGTVKGTWIGCQEIVINRDTPDEKWSDVKREWDSTRNLPN